jgi:hypothetical protein
VGGDPGDDQQVEDLVVAEHDRHRGRGGAGRTRPPRPSRPARRPRSAARRPSRGGRTAGAWPPLLAARRCLRAAFVDTQGVTELSRGLVAA